MKALTDTTFTDSMASVIDQAATDILVDIIGDEDRRDLHDAIALRIFIAADDIVHEYDTTV